MSQEQPQRPLTYGDVFPGTQVQSVGLATQPVTLEDASLMQSAESLVFGRTQKGGPASQMQSAADRNVDRGLVDRDAHTVYSEYGMGVSEVAVPGAVMDVAYIAGKPVSGTARPAPAEPVVAAMDAVTIGEALEAAAVGAGDKLVDRHDARAIESAEIRATGLSGPIRGGPGSVAQSAADQNERARDLGEQITLADVLMDATTILPADKVATREDAQKVILAELRYRSPLEGITEGGVAAAIAAAANLNERTGFAPPPLASGLDATEVIPTVVHVGVEVVDHATLLDDSAREGDTGPSPGGDQAGSRFGATDTGLGTGEFGATGTGSGTGGDQARGGFGATATGASAGGDQASWPGTGGDQAKGGFGATATGGPTGEDQAEIPIVATDWGR